MGWEHVQDALRARDTLGVLHLLGYYLSGWPECLGGLGRGNSELLCCTLLQAGVVCMLCAPI